MHQYDDYNYYYTAIQEFQINKRTEIYIKNLLKYFNKLKHIL